MKIIHRSVPTILSLGGSLIFPKSGIALDFLSGFRDLLLSRVRCGERFVVICGGGSICRAYQQAAQKIVAPRRIALDWLGIRVTHLNAYFLQTLFSSKAHLEVVTDPKHGLNFQAPLLIAAGWKPGCSTDFDAVLHAELHGAKKMFNLSNTDYVYTKDPSVFPEAEPYRDLSWKALRKIVGSKRKPGLNVPFDPIAAKRAERIGLEVAIVNGAKLDNLKRALLGKEFVGTVIRS